MYVCVLYTFLMLVKAEEDTGSPGTVSRDDWEDRVGAKNGTLVLHNSRKSPSWLT